MSEKLQQSFMESIKDLEKYLEDLHGKDFFSLEVV